MTNVQYPMLNVKTARRVSQQPILPLPRFTPPVNPDRSRLSGALSPTGDVPEKTLPMPSDSTHFGEPAVSPTLPSTVSASALPSRWLTPPPTTRLSAWVESDVEAFGRHAVAEPAGRVPGGKHDRQRGGNRGRADHGECVHGGRGDGKIADAVARDRPSLGAVAHVDERRQHRQAEPAGRLPLQHARQRPLRPPIGELRRAHRDTGGERRLGAERSSQDEAAEETAHDVARPAVWPKVTPPPSRNVTFSGLRESLMPGEINAGAGMPAQLEECMKPITNVV